MRTSSRVHYALGFLAGVAILTGCNGTGSTSGYISTARIPQGPTGAQQDLRLRGVNPSKTSQGWLSDQAKTGKQLLFVADQPTQSVYIFPQRGKNPAPIGAITQGISAPTGLFVD